MVLGGAVLLPLVANADAPTMRTVEVRDAKTKKLLRVVERSVTHSQRSDRVSTGGLSVQTTFSKPTSATISYSGAGHAGTIVVNGTQIKGSAEPSVIESANRS